MEDLAAYAGAAAATLAAAGVAYAWWTTKHRNNRNTRRRTAARGLIGDLAPDVAARRLFSGSLAAALKVYRDSGCVLLIAVDPDAAEGDDTSASREVWTHSSVWSAAAPGGSSDDGLLSCAEEDMAASADKAHRMVPLRVRVGSRECTALLKLFNVRPSAAPFVVFLAGAQKRTWMIGGGASLLSPTHFVRRVAQVRQMLRASLEGEGAAAASAAAAATGVAAEAEERAPDEAEAAPTFAALPWPTTWVEQQRAHASMMLMAHGDIVVQLLVAEGAVGAGDVVVERGRAAPVLAAALPTPPPRSDAPPAIDGMSPEDAAAIAALLRSDQQAHGGSGGRGEARNPGASASDFGAAQPRHSMLAQQDSEYEASLASDRKKAEARAREAEEEEERAAEQALSDAIALSCVLEQRSAAERTRARVSDEPAAGDADVARVRFKLPNGSNVERRFRRSETLSHVRDFFDLWLHEHGETGAVAVGKYALSTSFPRRTFHLGHGADGAAHAEELALSIVDLGLAPSGVLMVQDLTS